MAPVERQTASDRFISTPLRREVALSWENAFDRSRPNTEVRYLRVAALGGGRGKSVRVSDVSMTAFVSLSMQPRRCSNPILPDQGA